KRVVVAEEVLEADIPLANVASMQTRSARPDRDEIDLRRLVSAFLRMAPDVAIVGEVRDREALPEEGYQPSRHRRPRECAGHSHDRGSGTYTTSGD
ncbi:MAG: Flp pilus assembly complex ATPase component, partial [bacterium]|nr:Flp pilus assembly complex ATPase component [bacterium]